jgi:hypothetical protein
LTLIAINFPLGTNFAVSIGFGSCVFIFIRFQEHLHFHAYFFKDSLFFQQCVVHPLVP